MEDFNFIQQKLSAFIRRFYINELLKGSILFFSIWLFYLILILLIEYFFWLAPAGRSLLFWIFIVVSAGLLFKFILVPLAKLFKLLKGITLVEASRMVGKHFPEVNDKLLNVLQLQNSTEKSDLLLASIAQKSRELKPVPFIFAVNFKSSLRYLKYAAFPVIIILAFLLTGNSSVFSDSYSRVVHYKTIYEPPAPFSFILNNDEFLVEEGKDLKLEVKTSGKLVPETITIHYNGEMYYLKSFGVNEFEYDFRGIKEDVEFYLSSNNVRSRNYKIEVLAVPKLLDFQMHLEYPKYIQKKSETVKGTGNVNIPEGTKVSWELNTKSTDEVAFVLKDSTIQFGRKDASFSLTKPVYSNFEYKIKTSNSRVKDHEMLEYSISVIKDQFPQITVEHKIDSIDGESLYFFGKVSDDHAVSALNMVYYTDNEEDKAEKIEISIENQVFNEFLSSFPGNLSLEKGKEYNVYFEVFDNDGIRGAKRSKSEIFNFREKSDNEIVEERLQQQEESIENLTQSLDKMQLSEQELKELSQLQKQKEQLNYNDRKKLDSFLERQKQQTEMMKNYSEKLKRSLEDKVGTKESSEFKEELKERLERNEKRLQESEALLEELQKYSDKISREELTEKLEKLSKQNSTEQKNLEQLLELTKRYYVQEKTQKLANDLSESAQKQEALKDQDSLNSVENQEEISKEFEEFQKQMEVLEKENENLKKPMDLGREEEKEEEIKEEQQQAEKNLENNKAEDAGKNQQKAAEKMKEMSKKMKASQMMAQGEQLNANIESMRQILSNLIVFSFEQEDLLLNFRDIRINNPGYAKELRKQQVLKEHFRHIDDSIFSLALNNPMITEKITSKLTDIEFNIDKSLERLAEHQLPQGTASQQYVMTGTNELALMLSDVLSNMQEMANPQPGSGGDGKGMQLPDIIQSQEQLKEKMQQGMSQGKGEEPKEGEGKDAKDGNQNGEEKGADKLGEEMSGELYEIFKEQQMLRQQLEDALKERGLDKKNSGLLREMENLERDVLEKGFNTETLERMNRIVHRLLQLESAVMEQEEEERRTSRTNENIYENRAKDQIIRAKEYFNSTEILNRQTLPLRPVYKEKVKRYFEGVEN
ncbi:hypothetical protein [Gillisia limnaea]|uniref:Glutamyl-tRNA synthetase n=1 Tax=Gillisia limnaea (strain DSM 15749 / LMG 21470 / R-8282) TaxID=865937 RepID=H2BUA0_GILLR|nr:hypothetical protein [Gillisia limnaea]EHQ02734.1 glutamyl-tRNA synthetase [Gillisia limnaea DSM 15749]